MILVSN